MRTSLSVKGLLLTTAAALALISPSCADTLGATSSDRYVNGLRPGPGLRRAGLGDIIVTATKRASTVQDVPFSINAQTQEDIQRADAGTIEDISRNVAGLRSRTLGPDKAKSAFAAFPPARSSATSPA